MSPTYQPIDLHHRIPSRDSHNSTRQQTDLTLDDWSYDGSIGTYNSAKRVVLQKSHPGDDFGIEFRECQITHGWLSASALVISDITQPLPCHPDEQRPLQVGDVVLSINGVSCQDQPGAAELAYHELRDAESQVLIEFQRLSNDDDNHHYHEIPSGMNYSSPPSSPERFLEVHHHQLMRDDGMTAGDGRTRSSTLSSSEIERFERESMEVSTLGSMLSGVSDTIIAGNLTRDATTSAPTHDQHSRRSVASQISCIMPISRRPPVECVSIAKRHPDEEIGLGLEVSRGVLYVSEVSPIGLLAGKPMLPGDAIVSINGKSFLDDPDAQEAAEIISNALTVVNFEIKASARSRSNKDMTLRRRLIGNCNQLCKKLACTKRVLPGTQQGETAQVPDNDDYDEKEEKLEGAETLEIVGQNESTL